MPWCPTPRPRATSSQLLDSGVYDDLKGKPVVTYCTGGIRCEVLSSLMTARGFGEVYQLEGGIVRYGEQYGDDGLWDGSLYVFDKRGSVDFSDHAAVIGECVGCGAATKRTANCPDLVVPHAVRGVRGLRQRALRDARGLTRRTRGLSRVTVRAPARCGDSMNSERGSRNARTRVPRSTAAAAAAPSTAPQRIVEIVALADDARA